MLLMGKSTISFTIFNSKLLVITRGYIDYILLFIFFATLYIYRDVSIYTYMDPMGNDPSPEICTDDPSQEGSRRSR